MAASMGTRTVSECSEGSGANDGELLQELGLLEAIYVHELNIDYNDSGIPSELSITLHPATAGNVDQQYVCLTLHLKLPEQYPNSLPEITVRNPRGVSDEHIASLSAKLNQIATERHGGAMLYELIEVAKESLTNNNTPSCQCVICLHGFTETDVFTRTECYHYFHSQCLARYLKHAQESEEKPVCAVCREPVTSDLSQLEDAPPPSSLQEVYTPNKAIRDMQTKMAALYKRQKKRGGIIDIEAENNKFLIHISQTPTLPPNVGISPVATQPQTQLGRGAVSQNDATWGTAAPTEEGRSTGESTRPVKQLGKKNYKDHQRNYPERPGSAHYKQGGRGWGRGRGSRGRGHTRPYSAGNKDYHPKHVCDGRVEVKGHSSSDKGSVKHSSSENSTSQSKSEVDNASDVDESKDRLENDSETVLDNESSKEQGHWSGSQEKHGSSQGKNNHLKEELLGVANEKTTTADRGLARDRIDHKRDNKIGDREKGKGKIDSLESNKITKTASGTEQVDKKRSAQERHSVRSEVKDKISSPGKFEGTDSGRRQNRRLADKNSATRSEGGLSDTQSKPSREKTPRTVDKNLKDYSIHDNSIHGSSIHGSKQGSSIGDKQYTDSATTASRESGTGRTRHWNRNKRGGLGQSKDSLQANNKSEGQCERSKGRAHMDSSKVGSDECKGKTKLKSAENSSRAGPSDFNKSKALKGPPPAPGFGEDVRSDQMELRQKSVKPPPGFENVRL